MRQFTNGKKSRQKSLCGPLFTPLVNNNHFDVHASGPFFHMYTTIDIGTLIHGWERPLEPAQTWVQS